MCKYCKLKTLNKEIGEKTNNSISIARVRDGSQTFDVYLNRYIVEVDNIHRSSLVLDHGITYGNNLFSLNEKYVDIKYCPFCGEEL